MKIRILGCGGSFGSPLAWNRNGNIDIKNKKNQYKVFENHIEASIESKLPLIIHQRSSEDEIIDVLNNYQKNHKLSVALLPILPVCFQIQIFRNFLLFLEYALGFGD